jgi:hypothetical protein
VSAQKDTPARRPTVEPARQGISRREDYYTSYEVATKKRTKPAILLGEIESQLNHRIPKDSILAIGEHPAKPNSHRAEGPPSFVGTIQTY